MDFTRFQGRPGYKQIEFNIYDGAIVVSPSGWRDPVIEVLKQIYTPEELAFLTYEVGTTVPGKLFGEHERSDFSGLPNMLDKFEQTYGRRYSFHTLIDTNQPQVQLRGSGVEITITAPNVSPECRDIPDIDDLDGKNIVNRN